MEAVGTRLLERADALREPAARTEIGEEVVDDHAMRLPRGHARNEIGVQMRRFAVDAIGLVAGACEPYDPGAARRQQLYRRLVLGDDVIVEHGITVETPLIPR